MSSDYYGSIAGEIADRERERLTHVSRCQMCGRSATGAGWDLLRHAQAMNFALGAIRTAVEAEGRDGTVPAESILCWLNAPYRFPLPDEPPTAPAGNTKAITAAGAAIERELLSGKDYSMSQDSDEALARVALLAAAPILAEADRAVAECLEPVLGDAQHFPAPGEGEERGDEDQHRQERPEHALRGLLAVRGSPGRTGPGAGLARHGDQVHHAEHHDEQDDSAAGHLRRYTGRRGARVACGP